MKNGLSISLFLNVVLITAVAFAWHHRRENALGGEMASIQPNGPATVQDGPVVQMEQSSSIINTAIPFSWSQVASSDYLAYIDNLGAIHCPAPIIRRIITGAVNRAYNERIRAASANSQSRFWDLLASYDKGGRTELDAMRDSERNLCKERDDLLVGLLPPEEHAQSQSKYESLLGDAISADTVEKLHEIEASYEAQITSVKASNLPPKDADVRVSALTKLRESAMLGTLTPAEAAEFTARDAKRFSSELYGFDVTEEELRALAQLEAKAARQNQTNREAAGSAIKEYLGEKRFTEYQRSKTPEFAYLWRLSVRYEFPLETAVEIYDIQQQAQAAGKSLRNRDLTPEARESALDELQTGTRQTIGAKLGPEAAATYNRAAGQWIEKLGEK